MQKLVAYLLERREEMDNSEARAAEVRRIKDELEQWLTGDKGAASVERSGSYRPEDGSKGTFKIDEAADGDRTWWMLRLDEETPEGRLVVLSASISAYAGNVAVFVTIEAGGTKHRIEPVKIDPRCPKFIRNLLGFSGRWYQGNSTIQALRFVNGFEDGEFLAEEIQHQDRTVPILVVSQEDGEFALPELHLKLAYDLAGLANVVVVDEDASWALTDTLGSQFGCYRRAVRLFWPQFNMKHDSFQHPLWTAARLSGTQGDPAVIRERFRKQVRDTIFRASALGVIRPHVIDDIRDAASRRVAADLKERASSLQEYRELVELYQEENERLHSELDQLRSQLDNSQMQIARLESDKQALQHHLSAKKESDDDLEEGGIAPSGEGEDADDSSPAPGETRYYKKVHSKPSYDVMKRVKDCGCNNWQGAHGADKARKGISRVEKGRSDWKSIYHCASCSGGGMWKVRW